MIKKNIQKIIIFALLFIPLVSFADHRVYTNNANNITTNSATLNGIVQTDEHISSAIFRYSTTPPIGGGGGALGCLFLINATQVNAIVGPVDYDEIRRMRADISGLTPGTTYYFCALATSHGLQKFGTVFSFTTLLTNPPSGGGGVSQGTGINMIPATAIGKVVTEDKATGITDIQATFHGSVTGIAGGTAYGYFRYSAQKTPPIFCNEIFGSNMRSVSAGATGSNHASGVVTNGDFDATVVNLVPNTVYYYCAIVSNGAKSNTIIKYGQVRSFRTYPCQTCDQTRIFTTPAVVINGSSANLNGDYGSTKALTTYFEYKNSELNGDWIKTIEEDHVANSYGRMTAFIKGLVPETNYMFRAVGRTDDPVETFYGQTLYFETRTADGFGDGEGWIYEGDNPWVLYGDGSGNGGGGGDDGYCNPAIEDCDGGTDVYCNPAVEDCDGGTDVTCNPALEDCDDGIDISCNPALEDCDGGVDSDCNPVTQDCDGNGGGGYGGGNGGGGYGGYTPNDYSGVGGGFGDFDNDGIENGNDNDQDGDGNTNTNDNDTDGDGIGNGFDTDDDNDGIFDSSDQTPLGNGSTFNDLDGDGLSNGVDTDDDGDGIPDVNDPTPFGTGSNVNDLDGDGINNSIDSDIDGDGIPNSTDPDDDNDGLPDHLDNSASGNDFGGGNGGNGGNGGGNQNQGDTLGVGDETTPPQDAIVRYHEGVETVFIRQIMRNTTLAKKYGYRDGEDLQKFSWYLAHFLGKSYGYVAKNKKEVRVRFADVAAYELKEVGNTTTVYESYDNAGNGKFKITGVRKLNSLFKMIFKYEYYFLKRK